MALFRQFSINARLGLMVGLLAFPLSILTVVESWRHRINSEAEALEGALMRARILAARVDEHVNKVDAMLTSLGRSISLKPEDADRVEAMLTSTGMELPASFGSLRVSGTDGIAFAHSNGARTSIADRRYFQLALARPGLAIGEPTRVVSSDDWTLGLARQIVGEGGRAAGVVSITTRLSGLQKLLDVGGLPAGSVVTLLDDRGTVLAHTREFATWVGRKLEDTAEVAYAGQKQESAMLRTSADGAEWLASQASLRIAPWHVHVSIPAREAFAASNREFQWAMAILLATLCLALPISWRAGRAIVQPITELTADTMRFGAGDTAHRARADEGGEVGLLAGEFNRMADGIARREAELRESEAKFRAMVEASPVGIFLARPDGEITYNNPADLRILGLSADEALGLGWIKAIHPEDRDVVAADWHKAIASGAPYRGYGRYLHGEGKVVWWQIRTAEVKVGARLIGLVGMVEDITETRETQAALRDSERRYRAMFASNPQPMWVYDLETMRFLDVNDAAIAHYGYSRDEFRGMTVQDLRPDEDAGRLERAPVPRTAGTVKQGMRRHRRKSGRIVEVEIASHDLMFNGRRAVHVLANDVTERLRVEREILRLNAELEERVAARTMELSAANNELEAFTYSVAHDLRAPLRGIDGFSALLVEQGGRGLDAESSGYIERIRSASQRMGTMISDLLDLSRVSRRDLYKLPIDLSAMAREIIEELQRTAPAREVDWKIAPDLRVNGDPGLMRLVLDNLLGNAWKYSRDAAAPRIEFGSRRSAEGRNEIFVRDNGVGFDMQYANKLFSVFQRLHSAEEYEGTGIGLVTVRRIVERHGGAVHGEAAPGKGATFTFWLPD